MLLDEFKEWQDRSTDQVVDRDLFTVFYNKKYTDFSVGQVIHDLAYQIYHLQVCVEGMIEDME